MSRGLAFEAIQQLGLPPFEGRTWSPRLQTTMLTQIHRALARGEELGAPRS
jgi:hypothetical protein